MLLIGALKKTAMDKLRQDAYFVADRLEVEEEMEKLRADEKVEKEEKDEKVPMPLESCNRWGGGLLNVERK